MQCIDTKTVNLHGFWLFSLLKFDIRFHSVKMRTLIFIILLICIRSNICFILTWMIDYLERLIRCFLFFGFHHFSICNDPLDSPQF